LELNTDTGPVPQIGGKNCRTDPIRIKVNVQTSDTLIRRRHIKSEGKFTPGESPTLSYFEIFAKKIINVQTVDYYLSTEFSRPEC